jgi:hypothetical protein
MNERYPIEQLARSARTRFPSGFAHMAMKLMPSFEGAALESAANRLRYSASTRWR